MFSQAKVLGWKVGFRAGGRLGGGSRVGLGVRVGFVFKVIRTLL